MYKDSDRGGGGNLTAVEAYATVITSSRRDPPSSPIMALLLALFWLACPIEARAAQSNWRLTLEVTGGIAGVERRLDLASTGDLEVVDRRRGTRSLARVSAEELNRIASLVAALEAPVGVRPSPCADCFNYSLDVDRSGRILAFRLNDLSAAASPAQPLLRVLTALLIRELTSRPPDAPGSEAPRRTGEPRGQ
jgi:hypothetical protein